MLFRSTSVLRKGRFLARRIDKARHRPIDNRGGGRASAARMLRFMLKVCPAGNCDASRGRHDGMEKATADGLPPWAQQSGFRCGSEGPKLETGVYGAPPLSSGRREVAVGYARKGNIIMSDNIPSTEYE